MRSGPYAGNAPYNHFIRRLWAIAGVLKINCLVDKYAGMYLNAPEKPERFGYIKTPGWAGGESGWIRGNASVNGQRGKFPS